MAAPASLWPLDMLFLPAHQVAALQFNASGTLLASGGLDGAVLSCKCACQGWPHSSGVDEVPGFHTACHGSDFAGRVGIWESSSGQCRHVLEGPDGAIEWLHWHPRGDLILAGSEDFTAWLWNAQTGAFMTVCNTLPCQAPAHVMPLLCAGIGLVFRWGPFNF